MIPQWSSLSDVRKYPTYGFTAPAPLYNKVQKHGPGPKELGQSNGVLTEAYWLVYQDTNGDVCAAKEVNGEWDLANHAVLFNESPLTRMSFTFDQQGKVFVFYEEGGELRLYWFDPLLAQYTTNVVGAGKYPVCAIDFMTNVSNPDSEINLFYVRADKIYNLNQRNRFTVETDTGLAGLGLRLFSCGVRADFRYQIVYSSYRTV